MVVKRPEDREAWYVKARLDNDLRAKVLDLSAVTLFNARAISQTRKG